MIFRFIIVNIELFRLRKLTIKVSSHPIATFGGIVSTKVGLFMPMFLIHKNIRKEHGTSKRVTL